MHLVVPVLPFLLAGCFELLGGDCPPRSLSVVVRVSADELEEALADDGDLSAGECKHLCPDNGVDKVIGCSLVEPDTTDSEADTDSDTRVSCDVEMNGDCL